MTDRRALVARLADLTDKALEPFVRESNRIEGILRDPTPGEMEAHRRFVPTVAGLQAFTRALDPQIELREHEGMNVRVGGFYPPPGGPRIPTRLAALLEEAPVRLGTRMSVWDIHVEYESLHPFTDGNGRSGRALWLWMMFAGAQSGHRALALGFLHAFYYQTLEACGV